MHNKISLRSVFSILSVKGIYTFTLLGVLISALTVFVPYLLGLFINSIIGKTSTWSTFIGLCCLSLSLVVLKKIYSYLSAVISKRKFIQLQKKYLKKITSYSPSDLEKFKHGELAMKFFRDIKNIGDIFTGSYPQIIEILSGLLFSLCLVFYSNWVVGLVFILFFPLSVFFVRPYLKKVDKVTTLTRKTNDNFLCKIFEIFYLMSFFKSTSTERFYKKYSSAKFTNLAKLSCIGHLYEANSNFVVNLFLALGELLVLGVSTYLVHKEVVGIGDVVFYQMVFVSSFNSFSSIYKLFPSIAVAKDSVISLRELDVINLEKENSNNFYFTGNVELQNVSFSYVSNDKLLLKNFSLKVSTGELVLIKGINGVGKTTLLKILSAYSKVTNGVVLFDGIDIDKINLQSLRSCISIVSQDFQVISDSIKNNITLNDTKYSLAEINNVIALVGLTKLVENLDNGINEIIGNAGRKLSGGEMQKIAIARALIRKPKLLILDEITNHLDVDSQGKIVEIVEKLRGKVTMFFVSHNSNVDILFDKIVEL